MSALANALAVSLLLAAASAGAADDDRRLDPALRLLHRAGLAEQGVPVRAPASVEQAAQAARRLGAEVPGPVRSGLLPVLVRSVGTPGALQEAGLAIQAHVGTIYAGQVPADHLGRLLELPEVQFVQASRRLSASMAPVPPPASAASRPAAADGRSQSGAGALIGYIDTGVDVFHHDFRKADGTTRIKYLLDLSLPGDVDDDGDLDGAGPHGGTLFSEADINQALQVTGTIASRDLTGHGTHGLSIAAGDEAPLPGVAPAADLIVVKATRESASLGFTSTDIVSALQFVDDQAAVLGQPYVANLSLGTLLSSHDGRSLEEQAIDALVGPGIAGKAVVVAAGNAGDNRGSQHRHIQGTGFAGLTLSHTLAVPSYTPNAGRGDDRVVVDLWYEGRDRHNLSVVAPDGSTRVTAAYGDFADVQTAFGDVFIANLGGASPTNGDVEALVIIDDWSGTPPAAGNWRLEVETREVGDSGVYHGWLGEDSAVGAASPNFTGAGSDGRFLVGKPGGAYNAITVGSFARHDGATRLRTSWTDVNATLRTDTSAVDGDISDFSSPGRMRDGRLKPDLTAPGERVYGAVSRDAYPGVAPESIYRFHPFPQANALIVDDSADRRFGLLQGTSFAAPVVTGLAARILSESPGLDAIEVRNVLLNSALADAFTGAVPNEVWGAGKANLALGDAPLPSDLRILSEPLPAAVRNRQYNFVFTAAGGALPYAWSVSAGALPAGLALDGRGLLTGKPTAAGTFSFTVQVADAGTLLATRAYQLVVSANPALAVTSTAFPVARLGRAYSEVLQAEGGTPPYAWSLAGGALPPGLTLLANGRLDGVPLDLGRFDFTVQVQDAALSTARRSMKVKVAGEGGEDWQPLGKNKPNVNRIAVDPNDPAHVAVSTRGIDAVFQSADAGETWQATSINNNFNDAAEELGFAPLSSTLWAVNRANPTQPLSDRIYRYDTASSTWVYGNLARGEGMEGLDFDAQDGIYVSVNGDQQPFQRSSDGGQTWLSPGAIPGDTFRNFPQGSVGVYRADASSAIYVARTDKTFISTDRGSLWANVTNGSGGAVDVRVSQADPFDVLKLDGALWKSVDGGRNWTTTALPGTACCLDRSLSEPAVAVAGTSDGLFKTSDGGATWRALLINGLAPNVTAVAIDPANPDNLYVGTVDGVFHTSDGGQSWVLRNAGLVRRVLSQVAVSRQAPTDLLLLSGEGPYLSRTSGDTWTLSAQGVTDADTRAAVISPADPNLMYLANAQGLLRSENHGVTWSEPNPTFEGAERVVAVDADPFQADTVLAALGGTRGTYRSANRGQDWTPVNAGLPFLEPTHLAFARDVSGRVFIAFKNGGVYRSSDRGGAWTAYGLAGLTVEEVRPAPSNSDYLYARSGSLVYFRDPALGDWQPATVGPSRPAASLAVDPNDPLVAWAGVDHSGTAGQPGGIYRTTDGGRNWARLGGVLDSFDVVALATHPSTSGTLYAATLNGGAYRSTDGGVTWEELGNYGTVADLTNVNVPDPSNRSKLFAATEGYGVQVSVDGGKTYQPRVSGLTNLFVNAIAFDPDTPATVYAATDSGVFKSTDSASTWAITPLTAGEVTDIVTENEGATRRIWITVKGQGVGYSADAGASFALSTSGLSTLELTSVEVESIGATRRIWITGHGGDGVFYSDDLGATWRTAAGNGLTEREITDLAIGRGSTRRIWITTTRGVFFSDDAGLSWTDLSLGLPSSGPVSSVTIDPNNEEVLVSVFSGSEGGVYRGGSTQGLWTAFNSGLGELKVKKLGRDEGHVVDATTNGTTIYAATAGDGVYAAELQAGVSAPVISTNKLPDGVVRTPYAATLVAHAGSQPYFWSVVEGSLPPGVLLTGATGALSGQPGQVGRFSFTVQVADRNGRTGRKALEIEVRHPDVPAVSLGDVAVAEGNTGSVAAVFTATLSAPAASAVTVDFTSTDGTAAAPGDYTPVLGTLTFAAGLTTQSISVDVNGDFTVEPDETFFVDLSRAAGATIADARGQATIRDDDTPPVLAIGDAGVVEGDAGQANLVFTATLSRDSVSGVTVAYATGGGTASAGGDYVAASGTLTFLPGTTSRTLTVAVNGDTAVEPDETLLVDLTSPVNATLGDAQAVGTILNDDGEPTLTISDLTVSEGAPEAVLIVRLSPPASVAVSVSFATSDGTAAAPGDYQSASGTLTFPPGERIRTVVVPLTDDAVDEPVEAFRVDLSAPVGAGMGDSQAQATVVDDDTRVLAVGRLDVPESAGSAPFAVTLSAPAVQTVTVDYATVDGTALAGSDYTAAAGRLTFPPGLTAQVVNVPVAGDVLDEDDESFALRLASPQSAVLASIAGSRIHTWTQLSPPSSPPIRFGAVAGYDESADRMVVFGGSENFVKSDTWVLQGGAEGEPRWVALSTSNDPPARTFHVAAYDPGSNRLIVHGGQGQNDWLGDVWVLNNANGLGGPAVWTRLPDGPKRVNSAAAYDPGSNRLIVFGGGVNEGSGYVNYTNRVWILQDANGLGSPSWTELSPLGTPPVSRDRMSVAYDPATNRLIVFGGYVQFSGATNDVWVLTHANGLGGVPQWTRLLPEGTHPPGTVEAGSAYDASTNRLFVFGGFGSSAVPVNRTWVLSSANGLGGTPRWTEVALGQPRPRERRYPAVAYSPSRRRLLVAFGDPTQYAPDSVNDAWSLDDRELVPGTATILDDDALPALSLADAAAAEGAGEMVFTASLGAPSGRPVRVEYATREGQAQEGPDYAGTHGLLTFTPGATSAAARVPLVDDPFFESAESFAVDLIAAPRAQIADGDAQGVITDDDAAPAGSPVPLLSVLEPTAAVPGAGDFELIVRGAHFRAGSTVLWNGTARPTTFVGPQELRAAIAAADIATARRVEVSVSTPAPGGGRSNAVPLPVSAPVSLSSFLRSDLTLPGLLVRRVVAADFDEDGKLDLAATMSDAGVSQLALWRGQGDGTFGARQSLATGPSTFGLVAADLDADGHVDLVSTNSVPQGSLTVLRGHGDGTFQRTDVPDAGTYPGDLVAGDFNGDGHLDVAVMANYRLYAFLGRGDGTLAPPLERAAPAHGMVAGEFNGDGRLDVAAGLESREPSSFPGNGDGTFGFLQGANSTRYFDVAVLDANRDGILDLASNAFNAGYPTAVFLGSGAGTFLGSVTTDGTDFTLSVAAADVDSDGWADLLLTSQNGYLQVKHTLGSGVVFGNVATYPTGTASEPNAVVAADFDSDGRLDLATANTSIGTVSVFLNRPAPALALEDVSVLEGQTGTVFASFGVTLSAPVAATVSASYATADGTAAAPGDYTAASGTVVFPPGSTRQAITVPVLGDRDFEADETFLVNLSSPSGAVLADSQAVGTIRNDDVGFILSAADAAAGEGAASAGVQVNLAVAHTQEITVAYATADLSALAGLDYVATSGTLTFPAGSTQQSLDVPLLGDGLDEPDETFTVNLSAPTGGGLIGDGQAVVTITDDDPLPSLSVNDVSRVEGNGPPGDLVFTVSLSAASGRTVTVGYATADQSALSGLDYAPVTGVLTFAPGVQAQAASVPVLGDTLAEGDETLLLNLGAATNAAVSDAQGTGTIVDDDGQVPASMSTPTPGSVFTSDTVAFTWTTGTNVAQYWLEVGSTLGGSDLYGAAQGTALTRTVSGLPVDGRGVFVRLWSLLGASWQFRDYPYRAVTAAPAQLGTPAPGATLSGSSETFTWSAGSGVSRYWLQVGSTPGGHDLYDADQGTLLTRAVSGLPTDGRTLHVRLWSLMGARWEFVDASYLAVTVTPVRAALSAPAAGSTFTSTSVAFAWTPGVGAGRYWLEIGSAPGGTNLYSADQGSATGVTVSGLPSDGSLVYARLWSLIGSSWLFTDASFRAQSLTAPAQLTSPAAGSTLAGASATFTWNTGTGVSRYWLYVGSAPGANDVYDADQGTALTRTVSGLPTNGQSLYVRLWSLVGSTWRFEDAVYRAAAGTASLRADLTTPAPGSVLTNASTTFTWTAGTGVSRYWLSVGTTLGGAQVYDADQGVGLTRTVSGLPLSGSAVYVRLWSQAGASWVYNDYSYATPLPGLSVGDVTAAEGNSGVSDAVFTVTLSAASTQVVTVAYATADGTATAGSDYTAVSGTLTFSTGVTSRSVSVPVLGDVAVEGNETFTLNLSGAANATVADGQGLGTITNDDTAPPPSISIADASVAEGNSGSGTLTFSLSLSASAAQAVTVSYATAAVTATAGSDYATASGVATFAAGTTSRTLAVTVFGDTVVEGDETLQVNLSSPVNATLGDGQALGTILDDDVPAVSIGDAAVDEGNSGSTSATFTLTLTVASPQQATVAYATADGSANAGSDYVAASGVVTFPAGTTTRTLSVSVLGDGAFEPDETFTVTLSSPSGLSLADGQGQGTIRNDDASGPSLSVSSTQVNQGAPLTLTGSNPGGTTTDWIGLFATGAADASYITWSYLNGSTTPPSTVVTSISLPFTMPATSGTYEFRMFASNGFTRRATSPTVTVLGPTISVSPGTASPGQSVNVTVANGPGHTTDWVGLVRSGQPSSSYVAWMYLNGTQNPPATPITATTVPMVLPAGLASGTYTVRFFASNGFTLLAESGTLTVP